MRTLLTTALMLFFSISFCQKAQGQTHPKSFDELHEQLLEMQRRMMEQFRNSPFNDFDFAVPQWDTTFQFRFDTTFDGGSISQFFRISPFGTDTAMQGGFLDFDRFLGDFFHFGDPFRQPDLGIYDFPPDDGQQPDTDDGLLPEERLRRQEEQEKSKKTKPAEPKPDPKIKTIRI